MKYKFDGYNWLVRLEKDEKLVESLNSLARSEQLPSVWINGVGACGWAEVGFYDLANKQYKWKKFDGPMEILSLQGNLSWNNNEPYYHLHIALADKSMQAVGGHLKELEVHGTCEVLLHKWYDQRLDRQPDDETGLNLLNL